MTAVLESGVVVTLGAVVVKCKVLGEGEVALRSPSRKATKRVTPMITRAISAPARSRLANGPPSLREL
jgi:hypothetical protein